jgi:hypothetical protein
MHPVAMAGSAAPNGDGRRTDEEGENNTCERCKERRRTTQSAMGEVHSVASRTHGWGREQKVRVAMLLQGRADKHMRDSGFVFCL